MFDLIKILTAKAFTLQSHCTQTFCNYFNSLSVCTRFCSVQTAKNHCSLQLFEIITKNSVYKNQSAKILQCVF